MSGKALWTQMPNARLKPAVKKRRFIRPVRKAMVKEKASYAREAKAWIRSLLSYPTLCYCPVMIALRQELHHVNEVHHKNGKLGPLLRDKRFWMGVSRAGHQWIDANKKSARERGWLCELGQWNKSVPKEIEKI